jgi:hypothetical protein
MNRDLLPSREELLTATRATFKLGSKQNPTAEQLKYTMTLLVPSLYALEHHSVKGGKQPVTFSIPNYNEADRRSHRPWQVDIINDQSPDKVIMKS